MNGNMFVDTSDANANAVEVNHNGATFTESIVRINSNRAAGTNFW